MAKVYCYYRPATESGASWGPSAGGHLVDFGHFLIEVEKNGRRTAFDYWPEGQRSVVKTVLPEDRNRKHLYLSFFVSDADADRMTARIRQFAQHPPGYEFPSASTCVSRSNEILSLAGLGIDGAITPAGLWAGLIDKSLRGAQLVWRDRRDQRIEYPHEYMPQRHGVPLPPTSEQAWLAGEARRWQLQQAHQMFQQQQGLRLQQQQTQQMLQQQQRVRLQLRQQQGLEQNRRLAEITARRARGETQRRAREDAQRHADEARRRRIAEEAERRRVHEAQEHARAEAQRRQQAIDLARIRRPSLPPPRIWQPVFKTHTIIAGPPYIGGKPMGGNPSPDWITRFKRPW